MNPIVSASSYPSLIIRRIGISRLDGIHAPFEIDTLCAGINLIHGPNAIGKSRTATALQGLIWATAVPLRAEFSGAIQIADQTWFVEYDERGLRHQLNGIPVTAPGLADRGAGQRDRYLLTLHELLSADNRNFAEEIQRESAGGYDLSAARGEVGTDKSAPKPAPGKARNAFQEATDYARQLREQDRNLQDQEHALVQKHIALSEAIAADARHRLLESALEHANAKEALLEATAIRASFEDPIGCMHGNEAAEIERIENLLTDLREKLRDEERVLANAKRRLEETGLDGNVPAAETIITNRVRLNELHTHVALLKKTEQEIEVHRSQVRLASLQIGDNLHNDQLTTLADAGLRQLADVARKTDIARGKALAQAELQRWVGDTKVPTDLARLRQGTELLSSRIQLAGNKLTPTSTGPMKLALVLASLVIAIEAAILAISNSPAFAPLALLALPIVYVAFRPTTPESTLTAAGVEKTYGALELPLPKNWTSAEINPILADLRTQLAAAELDQEKAARWSSLEALRIEAELAHQQVAVRRSELTKTLGVSPELDPDSLRGLADALAKWQQEIASLAEAEAIVTSTTVEINRLLEHLNHHFTRYGIQAATDAVEAQAKLDQLAMRTDAATVAAADSAHQRRLIAEQILPAIGEREAEIERIYAALGITARDNIRLRELCAKVPLCQEAQRNLEQAETIVAAICARLTSEPGLADAVRDDILAQLQATSQIAARQASIQEEITRIRNDVEHAMHQTRLESAIAKVELARDALLAARENDRARAAAWQLFEFVHYQTRDTHRPAVFHKARAYFTDFTAGAFKLELDDSTSPSFRAVETVTGRGLSLNELSSGTRVQLLMAVRLAFIESMEQSHRLPLILDEALGNTDDVRANAIIDAAIEISRRGRQVIYFTAQGNEVAKWRTRLAVAANDPEFAQIDLAVARRLATSAGNSVMSWNEPITLPIIQVPDGTDHSAARKVLRVAPIDPWSFRLDGLDLWYLVPDVPTLVALRNLAITTWGQFGLMRSRDALRGIPALDTCRARAQARVLVIESAVRAWKCGRPQPLSRDALSSSKAISDIYFAQAVDLSRRCDWNGAAVLRALRNRELSGFRQKSIDELEEFLQNNGFLTSDEPLSQSLVRAEAMSAVSDEVKRGILTVAEIDELLGLLRDPPPIATHDAGALNLDLVG